MAFAPHYFAYLGKRLLDRDGGAGGGGSVPGTCLAKVVGVFSVSFKPNPSADGLDGLFGAGGGPGGAEQATLLKELRDQVPRAAAPHATPARIACARPLRLSPPPAPRPQPRPSLPFSAFFLSGV
jgi:hypothetical protein